MLTVVRQLLALSGCLAVGGAELAQKVAELLAQLDRPCLGFLYSLQCVVRPAGHPAPKAAMGRGRARSVYRTDWPRSMRPFGSERDTARWASSRPAEG